MDGPDRTFAAAFVGVVATGLAFVVCRNMPWPAPLHLLPLIPIVLLAFAALYNIGARD